LPRDQNDSRYYHFADGREFSSPKIKAPADELILMGVVMGGPCHEQLKMKRSQP